MQSVSAPLLHGPSKGEALQRGQALRQGSVNPADMAPPQQIGGERGMPALSGLQIGLGNCFLEDPLLMLKLLPANPHLLQRAYGLLTR